MHSLITWIAYGLGALFAAACVVAWWEHLGRDGRRAEEPGWDAPTRMRVSLDVDLDDMLAAATPHGDVGERRQALGSAISRMAGGHRIQAYGDTAPMVLTGDPVEARTDAAMPRRGRRDKLTAGA
jgi:hypothetical protein